MRLDESNRSWVTIRVTLAVSVVVLAVFAAGVAKAQQVRSQKNAEARTGRNSRPMLTPKATYVPGEVIVKLRDAQSGTGLLSLAGVGADEDALLRLKAVYGLSDDCAVFKGAHRRSSVKHRRSGELSQFYLLSTDRDVPKMCAELPELC